MHISSIRNGLQVQLPHQHVIQEGSHRVGARDFVRAEALAAMRRFPRFAFEAADFEGAVPLLLGRRLLFGGLAVLAVVEADGEGDVAEVLQHLLLRRLDLE